MSEPVSAHIAVQYLKPLRKWLERDDVTEVCVNTPGMILVEGRDGWECHDDEELHYTQLEAVMNSVANHTRQEVGRDSPTLSATLPGGERVQIAAPPVTYAGTISITVRKPNAALIPLGTYKDQGAFDNVEWVQDVHLSGEQREWYERERIGASDRELLRLAANNDVVGFLQRAVAQRKTIVVSGSTGSGKTTLMKSLVSLIQESEDYSRLLSVENVDELGLPSMGFDNAVPLFYSATAKPGSGITQQEITKSTLRMRPDRIFVAELIGGNDAFEFLNVINSGHPGSITSLHANSTFQAWARLTLLLKQSDTGADLDYPVLKGQLGMNIEVIVQIDRTQTGRQITEIYYDPAATLAALEG